jgi:uncharacterized protein
MRIALGNLVIIARVPARYDRGLIDYDSLRPDQGMLFPFDANTNVPFHTYGMRFPIDILFLDGSGNVVSRAESVPPGKTITSPVSFRAALELAAGTYAKEGATFVKVLGE